MFKAKCKSYYKAGNDKPAQTRHRKRGYEKARGIFQELAKQSSYPHTKAVWFLICYHFGTRGRGFTEMDKNTFRIVNSIVNWGWGWGWGRSNNSNNMI